MTKTSSVVALHMRCQGLNSAEIGRELDCSASWVRRTLKNKGFILRNAQRRLLEWEKQAIIDAYRDGEKRDAIAAEFGVDKDHVRRLARHAGLPGRAA